MQRIFKYGNIQNIFFFFFFFCRTHGRCGRLRPVIHLHSCLSFDGCTASGSLHHHQSVMSSEHLLGTVPRGRSPSTIPNITVFTSRRSSILHMCPNSFHFFALPRPLSCTVFLLFLLHFCW